ncbi:hypothetical protein EYZ11_009222 [Aspergillus tanneri]|uniref:DUF2293 domain-containing protein n=1 Tax=Aspergillus tanneri TaxID=1220188 RepID=A0A4S3J8M7_9EURO|nr:uncharacterized protein ATNIH1004_000287 [Aspergillus tanneri]KAA8651405.1 hypothetical protein ATNIH1004_000287 [Aspergillus tanneri]THC91320.1 hypothetical protein EYZ11_009222 [Aspergillus tanneri]
MASTTNSSRRKSSRKLAGHRKSRTTRQPTTLGSPRSILTRANGISKRSGHNRNAGRNGGRQAWKYSKFGLIPPSTEPFEENCFEREPIPENYVFVPKGDVYITRHCRSKTKESQHTVYVVYNTTGKWPIGLRVPSDIYSTVLQSAAATADSRANAVKLRDEKVLMYSRQLLRSHFPLMPGDSLEAVLNHAFLKGSGRVGRTATKTDERKAILAVEAHIRHTHTPYEELLSAGKGRQEARQEVWDTVRAIKAAWEGGGNQPTDSLALRSRMED